MLGVLTSAIRQQNEIKDIKIGKEVKLSLFTDDMILYMENVKDSTKKLLELIHEFSKVTGYKINVGKSVAFFNNEATERQIKKLIPFTIAPRTIKYLGINLTKDVKDLYAENYRKLTKEMEEDTKKWKNTPCSWIGTTNIVKMSTLSKAIYIRYNPNQNCISILLETRIILKFVWNYKRP